MNSTKIVGHTPGPWDVHYTFGGEEKFFSLATREPYRKFAGFQFLNENRLENKANARLIATAPELLEALRDCLLFIEGEEWGDWQVTADKARKAIAKATTNG